jgi:hypothetical protein
MTERQLRMRAAGYIGRFLSDRRGPDEVADIIITMVRDSDGTATAAANGDLPVPKDCQARAGTASSNSNPSPSGA